MVFKLPNPRSGDLEDFLQNVEAVSLLSSSTLFSHDDEIQSYCMGFSTSNPSVLEPTPIDPKSSVVVDTFRPVVNTNMWRTTDDSTNFDAIIHGLRTLVETSSSKKAPAAFPSGCLLLAEAPKRDLHDCSLVPSFSPSMKRARISSTRREVESSTSTCSNGDDRTLRSSHMEQWGKRFNELVEYKKEYGHCLVPLNWKSNPSLAHWVKRQRYQYRIEIEGKHSSMTPERLEALQALGFTWDSHSVAWFERWQELAKFKQRYGHPNVPKQYPENRHLAIWVKCQRRQYKLWASGQCSNMTPYRIERLNSLGFVFNPRSVKVSLMIR